MSNDTRDASLKATPSMLRKAGFLLLSWLIAAALTSQAMAGGLEDARRRGKLLAGVKIDSPPFGYLDSSGNPQGIDVEIARYLAKTLCGDDAFGLEPVPVTSGSRIPFLYSQWIDVIVASMSITEDRRKVLEFSKPYFLSGSLLLVRKDSLVKDLGDLSGKNVAVIDGAVQENDIQDVAPQAKTVKFPKIPEALQALRDKQVDAFCQDDVVILALAKDNPDLRATGKPFQVRPYAVAVRKGDVEFVRWIDAQLAKMKEDGSYEMLIRKYFGDSESFLIKP
jgi:ABC-type amino acid transport substrate-binding protein